MNTTTSSPRLFRFASVAALALSSLVVLAACEKDKPTVQATAPVDKVAPKAGAHELIPLDQTSSTIAFVGAKVTGKHDGTFKTFTGTVDLVDGKIESSQVTLSIDAASLATDDPKLDAHLQSPDFFDVAKFPKATFTSTEIKPQGGPDGATHLVTGNLELHGVKKSISFPAKISLDGQSVKAAADFAINRKDFGMVYPGMTDNLIKDEVAIKLTVNATRKKS
jgi:polyisoprenoid-binding protein YceI